VVASLAAIAAAVSLGGNPSAPPVVPAAAGTTRTVPAVTVSAQAGTVTPSSTPASSASSARASASVSASPSTAARGQLASTLDGCPVAPADSIWRARVDALPVASHSSAYVASIGAQSHVHADFGSGTWDGEPIGMPITLVPPGTSPVHVSFDYADESDSGPYPIPAGALIEGGAKSDGDRHLIALDPSDCRDYELYDATQSSGGAWHAGSGAVFNLNSDALRPAGWTSADAAGLPILPGLARYDEDASGAIDHALRITVPKSQAAYLWPARHAASSDTDADLPPMGLRLRLKADVNISGLPPEARVVAQALKTYGAIVADNGSAWYISGTQDSRWDNDQLDALKQFTGADFEAVDASSLEVSGNSGQASDG
jgi:hypothetical protein